MYSSCKRSIRRNTTWSAIYITLKRNIPKFDMVLLHSNWSSLRRKHLINQIPTDVNALSCGPKTWKISGISDAISPARHPQKSSQHVRACVAGDGAICSKNTIIVPYHGDNPNTWNGARLRSPSPIMTPDDTHQPPLYQIAKIERCGNCSWRSVRENLGQGREPQTERSSALRRIIYKNFNSVVWLKYNLHRCTIKYYN